MFFQHRSHSTLPPSIAIHRPSSIFCSQRTHTLTRGRFDAPLRRCSAPLPRPLGSVGLVCERVGSFGDLVTLSRWLSRSRSTNGAGSDAALAVGENGSPSSRSVSIARSIAPVLFATVRTVDADRERFIALGVSMVEEEEEE